MKTKQKLLAISLLLLATTYSCNSKADNTKAKELFLKNMTLLQRSANDEDFNHKNTPKTIEEMEELTSIPSKAACGYLGKLKPTQGDLIIWEQWYSRNKDKLYWDEDDHKIRCTVD